MSLNHSFAGKTVLITGGGQGIGRQLVQQFHDDGATVFTVDKNPVTIQKLREELPGVRAEVVDLADWDETRRVVESFGPIDHLVNNAALFQSLKFMDITKKAFNLQFDVNVGGIVVVTQVLAKKWIELGREGSVVNISSMAARVGNHPGVAYAATKAAVENLTKSMAVELGPHNIRVNCILPGLVDTPMAKDSLSNPETAASIKKVMEERLIVKRPIAPSEIGSLVMFLLSPLSSTIAGEGILIDAGWLST